MGGPPTDVNVPITPETNPAAERVVRLVLIFQPIEVINTPARTKTATKTITASFENATTAHPPAIVPITRPKIAHFIPFQSTAPRSRRNTVSVTATPTSSKGPGMKVASISASAGAETKPRPKPREPWIIAPTATTSTAKTYCQGDIDTESSSALTPKPRQISAVEPFG